MKTGQTHVQKYTERLPGMIADRTIDTTFLISHRPPPERVAGLRQFQQAAEQLEASNYLAFSGVICFHRRADLHGGDGCEDRPGSGTLMSAMPG